MKTKMLPKDIHDGLSTCGYCSTPNIDYALYTQMLTGKPLLIEGDPGVGKSSLAKAVANMLGYEYIRMQMYEGLTDDKILYDYDYQKQLLTLEAVKSRIDEHYAGQPVNSVIHDVASELDFYGTDFLIERPILRAINGSGRKVLLIDEIDKASEETEYMLYEFLEDYSISIPQYGEIICPADQRPIVFLTSNSYRELSGALKRRCNYLYIPQKTYDEMVGILRARSNVDMNVARGIASCFQLFTKTQLKNTPSIAEAIDFANYLGSVEEIDRDAVLNGIGILAKSQRDFKDIQKIISANGQLIWDGREND